MRPQKGSSHVEIPITFDSRGGGRAAASGKPVWVWMTIGFWLLTSIFVILGSDSFWQFFYPVLSFIVLSYVVRFIIFRENYFKKKRADLMQNNYMFKHNVFWNIYDIGTKPPYIVSFGSGMKGVFIRFDKDVIVGKPDTYKFDHHEALANALQQVKRRRFECIHIDLMDTVGKDDRLEGLLRRAEQTKNADLREVMIRTVDNIEVNMNRSYAAYDIYCFYSANRDDLFLDELDMVITSFSQANYIRHRFLDRTEISTLAKSLMNIEDFSVNNANDALFKEMNNSEYIRVIWTEQNGVRTDVNRTLEEIKEVQRVRKSEKQVRNKKMLNKLKPSLRLRKKKEEDIDLFD